MFVFSVVRISRMKDYRIRSLIILIIEMQMKAFFPLMSSIINAKYRHSFIIKGNIMFKMPSLPNAMYEVPGVFDRSGMLMLDLVYSVN